jgi:citrate lyase beta subunit
MLFCPAHRPERYAKAWASGARAVVLDLEDGVPAAAREQARVQALEWLATSAVHTSPVWPALRINALRTSDGWADLVAVLGAAGLPESGCLLLPKLDDPGELLWLEAHLGRRLCGLGFGAADLRAELGSGPAWEHLATARSMLVLAAAGTALRLLDVPCLALDDEAALLDECARARALGFHGKFVIHPKQLAAVERAFAPTPQELQHARRIVSAYEAAGGGACLLDGAMLDEPVVRQAQRCLASDPGA